MSATSTLIRFNSPNQKQITT